MPKKPFIVLAWVLMTLGCLMLGAGIIYRFLLPRFYKATARIKVEKDPFEFTNPGREAVVPSEGFDPFWVQTEFEKIQSKMILYPVISNLNLNRKWTEKLKTDLKTDVTYAMLKGRLDIRQSRNSSLIEISAWSDDPVEAATIANEIARVYRKSAGAWRRELRVRGITILETELAKQDQALAEAQALVDRLRQELSILPTADQPRVSADLLPDDKRRPYLLAKEELERLRLSRGNLKERIDQEKADSVIGHLPVEIIDAAEPPSRAARPNRLVGAAVLILGGVSLFTGFLLLLMTVRLEKPLEA